MRRKDTLPSPVGNNCQLLGSICVKVAVKPPATEMIASGTKTNAINMRIPCTVSVVHTAKNPPKKV